MSGPTNRLRSSLAAATKRAGDAEARAAIAEAQRDLAWQAGERAVKALARLAEVEAQAGAMRQALDRVRPEFNAPLQHGDCGDMFPQAVLDKIRAAADAIDAALAPDAGRAVLARLAAAGALIDGLRRRVARGDLSERDVEDALAAYDAAVKP